jgi:hypothetical protein
LVVAPFRNQHAGFFDAAAHLPRRPVSLALLLLPFSCVGKERTEYDTTTQTPHAPAGAYCKLCGEKLDKPVILTWKENEAFVWKHCMDSQRSFNGPSGAMNAMEATFPGGPAAWAALQAQMQKYAAEKNAAKAKAEKK